jgi:HEAT repeat protein
MRIIAMSEPSIAIEILKTYLNEDVDRQLQMGAVSGLADIESPQVAPLLIDALAFLDERNRRLAIEGLLRTEGRRVALEQAMAKDQKLVRSGELKPSSH